MFKCLCPLITGLTTIKNGALKNIAEQLTSIMEYCECSFAEVLQTGNLQRLDYAG
jgi:hypothetical protein